MPGGGKQSSHVSSAEVERTMYTWVSSSLLEASSDVGGDVVEDYITIITIITHQLPSDEVHEELHDCPSHDGPPDVSRSFGGCFLPGPSDESSDPSAFSPLRLLGPDVWRYVLNLLDVKH